MMDYQPNRKIIAKRIARFFNHGDVVNLGIGLPTSVADHVPPEVEIILHSENGFVGLGPRPAADKEDPYLVNAGAVPATIKQGGAFFDSALSFGIIRGGHLDYTVLGVLQVDQLGNLANHKIPGKMVPGMGGAMDLTIGAKTVIAATVHFDKSGRSKLVRQCSLPITAKGEVDFVVTDLGCFSVQEDHFVLEEYFPPYDPAYICEKTDADVIVAEHCKTM